MRSVPQLKYLLVALWLSGWIAVTRYAMLDDALIHLRYASFLRQLHFFTYDGVHASFGTSSPLFVALLAVLRGATQSALLPKAVSTICYVGLIVVLGRLEGRLRQSMEARLLLFGLLLTSLSPMAIRWLTDGMETSMALLAVVLLAWVVSREQQRRAASLGSYLLLLLYGAALVLLRVELAALAALTTAMVILSRLRAQGPQRRSLLLHGTALAVGAGVALVWLRVVFGGVLPDTALAKEAPASLAPLGAVGHVILGSLLLGIDTTLLYLLSATCLLRALRQQRSKPAQMLAWACANASFPLIVLAACLRGQAIQGIRYLLWPLFFAIVWNALTWSRLGDDLPQSEGQARRRRLLIRGYAAMIILLLPVDWFFALRVMKGRGATFESMRAADLDRFHMARVVAGDVGFIGYFTGAPICDLNGLVNGRPAALQSPAQRASACAAEGPQLLFLTDHQTLALNRSLPLGSWRVCRRFDFMDVSSRDSHYLLLPATTRGCPSGGIGIAARQVIPGL